MATIASKPVSSKSRTSADKVRIGIMIGDPGGVGPEVAMKAVASGEVDDLCTPVFIGKRHVLERTAKACGIALPLTIVDDVAEADGVKGAAVLECGELEPEDYEFGRPSVASGNAVWAWMEKAQELSRSGELDGWVMAPINSDSILSAGKLDDINDLQPKGTFMLRISGPLRIVPLSEHILLRDVADDVTPEKVAQVVRLLHGNLEQWGVASPRIAVAGINPHASFAEDVEKIAPAVKTLRAEGIDANGPVAPDSVFRHTIEGKYDAIVTMYHDQGQIALKTTAFEGACTIFMGLPYIMIGIPHGSAYDIAGTGKAQFRSFLAGLQTASKLAAGQGFLRAYSEAQAA